MNKGKTIFLNGVSSAEKTILAIDSAALTLLSASGTDYVKERNQLFTYVRIEKRGQRP